MTATAAHGCGRARLAVRRARPRDAPRISSFYERCYSSGDGCSPADNYPFPQILDPRWVEVAIETGMVSWLIAEMGGRLVGAAGLLHGLGSVADQVGECFGLVVDRQARGRGIGVELLRALSDLTRREVEVGIGQMRTADPAVAQVLQRCGFLPVGFEPFVHHMLAGKESMVAVAILSGSALSRRRRVGRTTQAVRRLAEQVLHPLASSPLAAADVGGAAFRPEVEGLLLKEVDDEIGADLLRRLGDRRASAREIIDLRRMDELGRVAARRKQRYFCGIVGGRAAACIHVAHNRHDHHLRIEAFASESEGTLRPVLRALLDLIGRENQGRSYLVVAELAATNLPRQVSLELLGFVPTIYYPALVARGEERLDVVQYTRLCGYSISDARALPNGFYWPPAERIVRTVTAQWEPPSSATDRAATACGAPG